MGECLEQLTVLTFLAGMGIRLVPSVDPLPEPGGAKSWRRWTFFQRLRVTLRAQDEGMEEEFQWPLRQADRGAVTNEYLRSSRSCGPARFVRGQILQLLSLDFLPKPVRSLTFQSGWAGRAGAPYVGRPPWGTAGTRWGPSPRLPWNRLRPGG